MEIILSKDHLAHFPAGEIYDGKLVRPFECPERWDYIVDALNNEGFLNHSEPNNLDIEKLFAVHEKKYVDFLKTCWDQWIFISFYFYLLIPSGALPASICHHQTTPTSSAGPDQILEMIRGVDKSRLLNTTYPPPYPAGPARRKGIPLIERSLERSLLIRGMSSVSSPNMFFDFGWTWMEPTIVQGIHSALHDGAQRRGDEFEARASASGGVDGAGSKTSEEFPYYPPQPQIILVKFPSSILPLPGPSFILLYPPLSLLYPLYPPREGTS